MAAGTLSAPGTEYGPCDSSCAHLDCAETRRQAETPCFLCHEPIGYERRFYRDRHISTGAWRYAHAACLEEDNERRTVAAENPRPRRGESAMEFTGRALGGRRDV
jgi:hypothetical protein